MFPRSTHRVVCVRTSFFLWRNDILCYGEPCFIYHGHLGHVHPLVMVNSVSAKVPIQVFESLLSFCCGSCGPSRCSFLWNPPWWGQGCSYDTHLLPQDSTHTTALWGLTQLHPNLRRGQVREEAIEAEGRRGKGTSVVNSICSPVDCQDPTCPFLRTL